MTQSSRYCAGCGEERLFEQFHAEPAQCPDVPDGECPEWGCVSCGEALLVGLPVPQLAGRGARRDIGAGGATRAA